MKGGLRVCATSWPRKRVVCAANSVRERTSSDRSMVTNSFATFVAISGRSYSKPIVKAIASLLSRFQFLFGRFDERPLANEVDDFRTRDPFQPTRGKLIFFRNGKQIIAGHHPLFDDLDAIVGERRDCRADKVAGDFLRLNKDRALRNVSRGPDER